MFLKLYLYNHLRREVIIWAKINMSYHLKTVVGMLKAKDQKKPAIDYGRQASLNQKSELVIHNKDGRIAQKDSHGHDPHPPKG